MVMDKNKTKIIIVGGGFAGIKTLQKLYKNKQFDITLITDQDTFRYGATIWRATTGYLKESSYIPIASLVPKTTNVTLLQDTATKIDRQKQTITTTSGKTLSYDYCVIGLGVVTSYFGIEGLEKYSFSIKSSTGFDNFRKHLHEEVVQKNALDKNYVVVGAGPTGTELAAALKTYLKDVARQHKIKKSHVNMELVEAAPRVLPMLALKASKSTHKRLVRLGVKVMTGKVVKGETATTLKVDTMSIPTQTVIWTAGVTNNPFFINNTDQFSLNDRKRVVVDSKLRVDERTFVIGDSAATKFSGLAITALHNASYVANVIRRDVLGVNSPDYKPLNPVTIIPIGDGWAVFQWRKIVFSGKFASYLRVLYDLIGYSEVMGFWPAFKIWRKRNVKHEDCHHCQGSLSSPSN
jgi:NADH:ubiquinone reductase (H+-translocating)